MQSIKAISGDSSCEVGDYYRLGNWFYAITKKIVFRINEPSYTITDLIRAFEWLYKHDQTLP